MIEIIKLYSPLIGIYSYSNYDVTLGLAFPIDM